MQTLDLGKFKSPYFLFLLFWLLTISLAVFTKSGIISAITMLYTGFMPFIYITLWLAKSKTGINIRNQLEKWHVAVMVSWFLLGYSIYSQKWAASIINEVFNIDAGKLGITYTLLAFLFTPFGVFYQQTVTSNLYNAFLMVSIIWGSLIPLLLFLPIKVK